MDSLRLKLEQQGLRNITYMVVNSQDEPSRLLHQRLRQEMSENITLYAQDPEQVDVWHTLSGLKDDFLVYDRCGRLTYHISLPYSKLSKPFVGKALREAYCNSICGSCPSENAEEMEACKKPEVPKAEDSPAEAATSLEVDQSRLPWHRHSQSSDHLHGHPHIHGHGHSHDHLHRDGQGHGQFQFQIHSQGFAQAHHGVHHDHGSQQQHDHREGHGDRFHLGQQDYLHHLPEVFHLGQMPQQAIQNQNQHQQHQHQP